MITPYSNIISVTTLFDSDAQAFFDRVTTAGGTLSTTEQDAVNTLVVQMKADGIWTKMKAIYPMVGASAAACAQNLKSSSFTGTFTATGWTFASTGVTPNGTSAYMDTGLSPSATFSSINSVSIGAYITDTLTQPSVFMGSSDGSLQNALYLIVYFNNDSYNRVSSSQTQIYNGIGTTGGFFTLTRRLSSSFDYKKNKTLLNTANITSTNLTSTNFNIGRTNYANSSFEYGKGRYGYVYLADGMTDIELDKHYDAVQAFNTTLSRQV